MGGVWYTRGSRGCLTPIPIYSAVCPDDARHLHEQGTARMNHTNRERTGEAAERGYGIPRVGGMSDPYPLPPTPIYNATYPDDTRHLHEQRTARMNHTNRERNGGSGLRDIVCAREDCSQNPCRIAMKNCGEIWPRKPLTIEGRLSKVE
jgi:hypothetical protein